MNDDDSDDNADDEFMIMIMMMIMTMRINVFLIDSAGHTVDRHHHSGNTG